jgi:hypothetical protein
MIRENAGYCDHTHANDARADARPSAIFSKLMTDIATRL